MAYKVLNDDDPELAQAAAKIQAVEDADPAQLRGGFAQREYEVVGEAISLHQTQVRQNAAAEQAFAEVSDSPRPAVPQHKSQLECREAARSTAYHRGHDLSLAGTPRNVDRDKV